MSFPWDDYAKVSNEASKIIADRDLKGRNAAVDFYAGFPHGSQDVSFEMSRRVNRILGMEVLEKSSPLTPTGLKIKRDDALDLINYAKFYVMVLDRETASDVEAAPRSTPTPPPKPRLVPL